MSSSSSLEHLDTSSREILRASLVNSIRSNVLQLKVSKSHLKKLEEMIETKKDEVYNQINDYGRLMGLLEPESKLEDFHFNSFTKASWNLINSIEMKDNPIGLEDIFLKRFQYKGVVSVKEPVREKARLSLSLNGDIENKESNDTLNGNLNTQRLHAKITSLIPSLKEIPNSKFADKSTDENSVSADIEGEKSSVENQLVVYRNENLATEIDNPSDTELIEPPTPHLDISSISKASEDFLASLKPSLNRKIPTSPKNSDDKSTTLSLTQSKNEEYKIKESPLQRRVNNIRPVGPSFNYQELDYIHPHSDNNLFYKYSKEMRAQESRFVETICRLGDRSKSMPDFFLRFASFHINLRKNAKQVNERVSQVNKNEYPHLVSMVDLFNNELINSLMKVDELEGVKLMNNIFNKSHTKKCTTLPGLVKIVREVQSDMGIPKTPFKHYPAHYKFTIKDMKNTRTLNNDSTRYPLKRKYDGDFDSFENPAKRGNDYSIMGKDVENSNGHRTQSESYDKYARNREDSSKNHSNRNDHSYQDSYNRAPSNQYPLKDNIVRGTYDLRGSTSARFQPKKEIRDDIGNFRKPPEYPTSNRIERSYTGNVNVKQEEDESAIGGNVESDISNPSSTLWNTVNNPTIPQSGLNGIPSNYVAPSNKLIEMASANNPPRPESQLSDKQTSYFSNNSKSDPPRMLNPLSLPNECVKRFKNSKIPLTESFRMYFNSLTLKDGDMFQTKSEANFLIFITLTIKGIDFKLKNGFYAGSEFGAYHCENCGKLLIQVIKVCNSFFINRFFGERKLLTNILLLYNSMNNQIIG